jgi:putative oxidoreductase
MPTPNPEALTSAGADPKLNSLLPLISRLAMCGLFLSSGIGKVGSPDATIAYIASAGLPFAPLGLVMAVCVEIGGSALLALGLFTRPVAAIMAAFSVATAVFFHAHFGDQMQFIHFLKNIAITGGLLQILAFGPGGLSLDAKRAARRA